MISIIIPLYNKQKSVLRAINSVLTQSYKDIEVVIVDDGSTDDSGKIVKTVKDSRLKYYYKKNGGVSSARNYGIKHSQGDWLYFLDADDIMCEGSIRIFYDIIRKYPSVKLITGESRWIHNGLEIVPKKHNILKEGMLSYPFWEMFLNRYHPSIRNCLIHKDVINEFGCFDERMSYYEDYEFILRMLKCKKVVYVNDYIGIYIQNSDGLSGSFPAIEKTMAYYSEEIVMQSHILYNYFVFESIELMKVECQNKNIDLILDTIQKKLFAWYYFTLHFCRHTLITKGIL